MPHPLVLALFDAPDRAIDAASRLHAIGIEASQLSIVSRNHEEEGALSRRMGGTPGAEIEDSRPAARLGELSARVVAAVALVLPGIGPIVAGGPLAAEFGELAGHAAGDLSSVLTRAGVPEARAVAWQSKIEEGAVLFGVHVVTGSVDLVRRALVEAGTIDIALAEWP